MADRVIIIVELNATKKLRVHHCELLGAQDNVGGLLRSEEVLVVLAGNAGLLETLHLGGHVAFAQRRRVGGHRGLAPAEHHDAAVERLLAPVLRLALEHLAAGAVRIGFEGRYKGLSIQPELQLTNAQRNVFTIETPTAGYAVFNLKGTYTLARQHSLHLISAELFNAGNTLYRNHLSFLKSFAPEIGRGVRFSYTLQVF